jgi:SAM-dependent methyltransferase
MTEVSQQIPADELILDAGAGDCRYRQLFTGRRYVGIDAGLGKGFQYGGLDVLGILDALPFRDETFDAALCMNVLEHVRRPEACLQEIRRVLKPNGVIYVMVPLFARVHQAPHDYYRYTSYGIRYLLEEAGFAVESVIPVGGTFGFRGISWLEPPVIFFREIGFWPLRLLLIPLELVSEVMFSIVVPLVCSSLDSLDRKRTHCMGYRCKARKMASLVAARDEV